MSNIRINEDAWNAVSASDKKLISDHLVKYRLLLDSEIIEGDAKIPTSAGAFSLDDFNPIKIGCGVLCDTTAGVAAAALTLSGPALIAALLAIEAARQECHNRC